MTAIKRAVVEEQARLLPSTAGSEGKYLDAQSTAADFNGPAIDCRKLDLLAFTLAFGASASRDGDFRLETTNDFRAVSDVAATAALAEWTPRAWPTGSTDGDVTVSGSDATIGAGAGGAEFTIKDLPAFARLVYDSQTAGAAASVTIWVFGRRK